MSQVIEIEEEEVETEKVKKAYLVAPNGHREATVLAFTTVLVGNKPINITLRAGWTEAEIDSIFAGMEYIGKLVDLQNGLFVTSNQYSCIETDEEGYVTGMHKIPTVYDKGQTQAATQAGLTEPAGPFAPGDDAPPKGAASQQGTQPAKQYAQPAPQQAQGTAPSNLIEFPVDRIEWAALSSTGNTTFKAYGGIYQKFGVVCYSEALQKAQLIKGGEGPGWVLNLEGKGYVANCAIGENGTSPKKVLFFSKVDLPF